MDYEFGISRWKLIYTRWINNKALLFPTAQGTIFNSIMKNHMERNMKRNVYIYITESLCCTADINTRL